MSTLGRYAAIIANEFSGADALFGPAYKGIPLATSAAVALPMTTNAIFSYLRGKEETHGGGKPMGAFIGNVVINDDAITGARRFVTR